MILYLKTPLGFERPYMLEKLNKINGLLNIRAYPQKKSD